MRDFHLQVLKGKIESKGRNVLIDRRALTICSIYFLQICQNFTVLIISLFQARRCNLNRKAQVIAYNRFYIIYYSLYLTQRQKLILKER